MVRSGLLVFLLLAGLFTQGVWGESLRTGATTETTDSQHEDINAIERELGHYKNGVARRGHHNGRGRGANQYGGTNQYGGAREPPLLPPPPNRQYLSTKSSYYHHSHQYPSTQSSYYGFDTTEYNYLPEDVRAYPFQNCIPESFYKRAKYGKKGVKHHHGDGNFNHHAHPHDHKKKGYKHGGGGGGGYKQGGGYNHGGGYYKGKKGGDYKSKGGTKKSMKGMGKGKMKSMYYRQRELYNHFRLPAQYLPPARTYNGNGGNGSPQRGSGYQYARGQGGRRGGNGAYTSSYKSGSGKGTRTGYGYQYQYENNPPQYQYHYENANDDEAPQYQYTDDDDEAPQYQYQYQYDYAEAGEDDDGGGAGELGTHHHSVEPELPICPEPTPIRNQYGPVPTIAPLGNSTGDPDEENLDGMMGEGAPVDIPDGTMRILVESALSFGFFPDFTDVRAPTQAEIDGLMEQTSMFYRELLQAKYPNLESFEATFVDSTTDLSKIDQNPVSIDFDANAFFTEGTTIPSPDEVLQVLQDTSYEEYIQMYVWEAEPKDGLFGNTQRAAYSARVTREKN